jgi:hypothetical protein
MESTMTTTKTKMVTFRTACCGQTTDIHPDEVERWQVEFGDGYGNVPCDVEGCGEQIYHEVSEGMQCTQYLNLYGLTQSYGGPEEGGWWYEQGIALGSIPLPAVWEYTSNIYHEELCLRPCIKAVHEEWARNCLNLTAMNDTQHYRIAIESSMASDYPRNRPHYE